MLGEGGRWSKEWMGRWSLLSWEEVWLAYLEERV